MTTSTSPATSTRPSDDRDHHSPATAARSPPRDSRRARRRRPRRPRLLPARVACDLGSSSRPGASHDGPAAAGRDAGARADPDPIRTDGLVALRLLPGRGSDHGRRPRPHAAHRARGATVRRRPLVQLRRLRSTRSPAGVQHQRLRRDPSRPVRVGSQTTRRQLCHRRATAGLQHAEAALDRDGRRRGLPPGDALIRRHEFPGGLVHPT